MSKLILLRHGQSLWNELDVFTGWVDIGLSNQGIQEAISAGQKIAHMEIDEVYVSALARSQMTALISMAQSKQGKIPYLEHSKEEVHGAWYNQVGEGSTCSLIPMYIAWELNERMYGQLQGMNKEEMRRKYGADQVHLWRRSYHQAPPLGESLSMTAERVIPFFQDRLVKRLEEGKNLFVSAHGNSLRAMAMYMERMTEEEVLRFEWPTGEPRVYEYEGGILYRKVDL